MINTLLDLVYPDSLYCICCNKIIDSTRPYRLCNDCLLNIKWAVGRTCTKCGKRLSANNPEELCYNCRSHSHIFRKGFTCAEYGSLEKSIIYALKYNGRTDIAATIGEIIYDRLSTVYSCLRDAYDLLVPVPIYNTKKLSRGFNQADLIARSIASNSIINYEGEVLNRVLKTRALRGLSPEERRTVINGAFTIKESFKDKIKDARILVVDDIFTTGSTVDEISKVLYDAGALFVDIVSFAAGADVLK